MFQTSLLYLILILSKSFGQSSYSTGVPSLRLQDNFHPRHERATLLKLENKTGKIGDQNSHSYVLSLGKGEMLSSLFQRGKNKISQEPVKQSIVSGVGELEGVVENVGSVVDAVAKTIDKDENGNGFTSLLKKDEVKFPEPYLPFSKIVTSEDSYNNLESRTLAPESRIPPPEPTKTYNLKRTSPHDIVGFSAVRASGFSRMGDSRIFFENTVTDANYGWDSRNSIFVTHYPGLYFFTFSVKADADKGDNFKYEVSLMKNGEEVVSVGGALDPSNKNVGTSASNSIILDLMKGDRVWLQLLRGNLVETANRKTGYSTFSGYKLGCGIKEHVPTDLSGVSLEEIAVNLDNESLLSLEEETANSVDRYDRNHNKNHANMHSPHVYSDENLYDAFEYDKDTVRGNLKPAHRPFQNNGPAIIEDEVNHNSKQDGYDDYFSLRDKTKYEKPESNKDSTSQGSSNKYSKERNKYYNNRDRYSNEPYPSTEEKHSYDKKKYSYEDQNHQNRDRYSDKWTMHGNQGERHYHTDRYNSNRYQEHRYDSNRYENNRHQEKNEHYSNNRNSHASDRLGYVGDSNEFIKDRYENNQYHGSEREQDNIREGAMFFHRRQMVEPSEESINHLSYGK